ncbi:hypothetical protein GCM10027191_20060 [Novilysobacter erysipheiresistens]
MNRSYCRAHVEHLSRHGSYSKSSYKAAELTPHRARALAWLRSKSAEPAVREAVDRVRTLYWRGGATEEAFRLAGKSPERRALICWARLRAQHIDPLHPLAAWLGVSLCHRADLQPERKIEYRWVQAAKVVFRMSGGSHKRWEHTDANGRTRVTEMHRYPASRGRVLLHLGEQLALATKPLEACLDTIESTVAASTRLPRAKRRRAL